jgi:hypothetical protein
MRTGSLFQIAPVSAAISRYVDKSLGPSQLALSTNYDPQLQRGCPARLISRRRLRKDRQIIVTDNWISFTMEWVVIERAVASDQ